MPPTNRLTVTMLICHGYTSPIHHVAALDDVILRAETFLDSAILNYRTVVIIIAISETRWAQSFSRGYPRLPLLSIHCSRPFMPLIRRVNCSRLGETYLLRFPRKIAKENRWFPLSVTDVIIRIKFFRSFLLIANARTDASI